MLRPQNGPTRDARTLDGLWAFRADAQGVGRRERWFDAPLEGARVMPVPSSYNDITPGRELREHVGEVWYETRTHVPRGWVGERVVLRLDSATHRATVWIDGHEVVSHEGGYTPFEADVTDLATPGESMRITVAVDNVLTWETIPPGIVDETAHGRRQKYMHDFFNYAGLHRSVWLYSTPMRYVADLAVVPGVVGTGSTPAAGTLDYRVEVGGAAAGSVAVRLYDGAQEVASGAGPQGVLDIPAVRLWQPGEGFRYDLAVELSDADGELIDVYRTPVGIRTVEVSGSQFLINGRPFHFTGFGMHEDHEVRGKGHSNADMVHDFELLRWCGANSLRTSHYPYAEEILEYCDANGIVVIDETAAVGMNKTVASTLGTSIDRVYGPDYISERTREAHAAAIRELIARDRNYACVVLWSIANEPESHTPESVEYFRPLFELARDLDPHRPVGFVNVQFSPARECLLSELSDVSMINRYFGWYTQTGDLPAGEDALEWEIQGWEEKGKPIIVTEFGADTVAGTHTLTGAMWSEEFQTEFVEMYLRVFDRHEAVVGEHLWNFADFATALGINRVDGNKKGAFTRDRRPKAVAHLLRKRWTGMQSLGTPQD